MCCACKSVLKKVSHVKMFAPESGNGPKTLRPGTRLGFALTLLIEVMMFMLLRMLFSMWLHMHMLLCSTVCCMSLSSPSVADDWEGCSCCSALVLDMNANSQAALEDAVLRVVVMVLTLMSQLPVLSQSLAGPGHKADGHRKPELPHFCCGWCV